MEGVRRSKRTREASSWDDKEYKRMTTRLQDRRHREENLRFVLNNHVVCENIASFVSFSDMKAASEVGREFLQAIRGTRRFTQKALLMITDENLEDIKSILMKTEYKWRGVKVDVTVPTNILEDLRRVLKSAEFVSLEGWPWVIEDRAVKDATAVSLLTAVVSSTPNLSQLKLDIRFISSNVGEVLSSPAVQQTLRNLSRLDLVRTKEVNCRWGYLRRYVNSDEENAFMRNFGLLTGLPNRLNCFRLTQVTPTQEKSTESLHRSVLQLLRNNRATLEEMELHLSVWQTQELQPLAFPGLKILTASVDNLCDDGGGLGKFLNNQRSLEELTLTSMVGVVPGDPLHTAIVKCSGRLKKLHLTGPTFAQFEWSFLGSMNRLKDFRLKAWGRFENGNRLLASLPKDQLESLSLEGLWSTSDRPFRFWSVEAQLAVKTQLLQGFRCVRKLSFLGSWDVVDDQLMQWLLKEFVSLEEFQVSECSTLTDAGITGNTTAEWGRDASFANLHRLTTLKIVECPGVTPNGVLASCVNVRWLRSLEYTNPPGLIVEWVVLEIVAQNPRLKRLSLDYHGDVGDLKKLQAKLMKKNPRVKLLLAEEHE